MGMTRILIADDHDIVRTGLRTILEAQPGWEVVGDVANSTSKLNLHGIEGEFAWNITVERAGKMMLVAGGNINGDQTVLIIYEACTFVPPQGPQ
jgi:hypothetical protein